MGSKELELTKTFGVYQIKCLIDSKLYVGSTAKSFSIRWKQWRDNLKRGKSNKHLCNSWNKYGAKNFEFSVLEIVEDKTLVLEREQYWMDALKPEFNICPKAGSRLEVPNRVRGVHKLPRPLCKCGKPVTDALHKNGWLMGYNATCGNKECGKRPELSEEAKRSIGDSKKGEKHHNWGKPTWNSGRTGVYSAEVLAKMSEARTDHTKDRTCVCGRPLKRKYTAGKFKGYSTGCDDPICAKERWSKGHKGKHSLPHKKNRPLLNVE